MEIKPQEGPQTTFLSTEADVAFYGGAAGGGKTFGMLIDPLRHIHSCPEAGAVYFRKTSVQIRNEGGLFDEAKDLYRPLGGKDRESPSMDISFPHPDNSKKQGFKVKRTGKRVGFIRSQSPAANTKVKKGTTITVNVGRRKK